MLDFLRCVSLWTNMLILVVIHTSNWLLYTLTLFRYCHTQLPQLEFWTMLIGYFIAVNNNNNIIHLCVSCSFFWGGGGSHSIKVFSAEELNSQLSGCQIFLINAIIHRTIYSLVEDNGPNAVSIKETINDYARLNNKTSNYLLEKWSNYYVILAHNYYTYFYLTLAAFVKLDMKKLHKKSSKSHLSSGCFWSQKNISHYNSLVSTCQLVNSLGLLGFFH